MVQKVAHTSSISEQLIRKINTVAWRPPGTHQAHPECLVHNSHRKHESFTYSIVLTAQNLCAPSYEHSVTPVDSYSLMQCRCWVVEKTVTGGNVMRVQHRCCLPKCCQSQVVESIDVVSRDTEGYDAKRNRKIRNLYWYTWMSEWIDNSAAFSHIEIPNHLCTFSPYGPHALDGFLLQSLLERKRVVLHWLW